MAQLTTVSKIDKQLKKILSCKVFGAQDEKVKTRGIFKYKGIIFFTAKNKNDWFCYEFRSGCATVRFGKTEESVINETKHKINNYCKSIAEFMNSINNAIKNNGFASHAKYSNLLPKNIINL